MPDALVWAGLAVLGFLIGSYGTMIGTGGGFLLVPALLVLYPSASPELVTSISLTAVFFNALSGTAAYARHRRIDYLAGNYFALATIPSAALGAVAVGFVPRRTFDVAFALVLIGVALFLVLRPTPRVVPRQHRRGETLRTLTDAHGDTYVYSYSLPLGVGFSFVIGFVATILGVGGGIIHVPAMIRLLRFPTHIATATSQYVLTITALTATVVHLASGRLEGGYTIAAAVTLGMVAGAQAGAALSLRLQAPMLVRFLTLAMGVVGARLLFAAFVY